MGLVYKARQRTPNRLVAIKMILAGRFASEHDVKRFHNESEAAAELDHPHIVPIYEVGEHDGYNYFSMKLIEGTNLERGKAAYLADPKQAAQLIATIARAIHHAHQRGVLHRDLKPSNILIDKAGTPFVVDFGLAKRSIRRSSSRTVTRTWGLRAYMAPEQVSRDLGAVTTATDVYGLGNILYVLLTGGPAVVGLSPSEILEKVMNRSPVPPGTARSARASRRRDDLSEMPRERAGQAVCVSRGTRPGPGALACRKADQGPASRARGLGMALVPSPSGGSDPGLRRGRSDALDPHDGRLAGFRRRSQGPRGRAKGRLRMGDGDCGPKRGPVGSSERGVRPGDRALVDGERGRAKACRARLADLSTVFRLEDIRMNHLEAPEDGLGVARAATLYAAAFHDYGIDVEHGGATDVAAQIKDREVRAALVSALDDWAHNATDSAARCAFAGHRRRRRGPARFTAQPGGARHWPPGTSSRF